MDIIYQQIGIIHSSFKELRDMPIQPNSETSAPGSVEVFPAFAPGLKDLDGFSHIVLLYHFHSARNSKLVVVPFLDSKPHGVFATRAPTRPNPIGLSIVRLVRVEDNLVYVEDLDILDNTPLLDIKPYVPEFDSHPDARAGWLEEAKGKAHKMKSDDRFS